MSDKDRTTIELETVPLQKGNAPKSNNALAKKRVKHLRFADSESISDD